MVVQKKWTEEEIQYLRKNCKKKTYQEMADDLNRTRESVRKKCLKMGILVNPPRDKKKYKPWTEQEKKYIQKYYGKKSIGEIARALNRTDKSVQKYAQNNGLTGKRMVEVKRYTEQEDEYLYKKYGKQPVEVTAKKLGRTVSSVKQRASSIGIHQKTDFNSMTYLADCFGTEVRTIQRWIEKFGLPCSKIKYKHCTLYDIDLVEFWKWAENHKDIIDFTHYEERSLPPEPKWVHEEKVKAFGKKSYDRYTRHEKLHIRSLIQQGYQYKEIAKRTGRTEGAIKHIATTIFREKL